MLVLVGPSGCGKTTTLRLIAGLEKPTDGSLYLEGHNQASLAPQERNVAMIFQHHALYPHLTARENIAFGLQLRKLPPAEINKRVGEATEILNLNGCLERLPAELSGGEQQRVALARALVRRPKVFLLDEPLSHLDAPLRSRMRREIRFLQRRIGAAMIYVTHDQTEAMAMGDRIAVMDRGRLQQIGTPDNVYRKPCNLFTAQFIGVPPMNVLHGSIDPDSGSFAFNPTAAENPPGESLAIPLPKSLADKARNRRKVALGVRPEHLRIESDPSKADSSGWFKAVVDLVETTGVESYVYLTCGSVKLVARCEASHRPAIGENLSLAFDIAQAVMFDSETQDAIA